MNIGNSDLKEIAKVIKGASKIALFPHVNMDGDAFGSCVALAHALRELGKECRIFISEEVPENLSFLDSEKILQTNNKDDIKDYSLAVLVDCGEMKRIPGREEVFDSFSSTLCIDHHGTTESCCQFNYIDPMAAATGQIVFDLINELILMEGKEPSKEAKKEIANAIFAAITTDTGNYQYSNTQKESHEITARLYDWGLEGNKVSVEIYESNRIERIRLTAEVLSKVEILAEGKVALAYCSQEMLKTTGAKMEETEWIAGDLRGIRGVEVAIFLKEEGEKAIKCSLRSKAYYDVAKLATEFGGGGHIRAAGYTTYKDLKEAIEEIKERVQKDF